jgi:hypothetical protein
MSDQSHSSSQHQPGSATPDLGTPAPPANPVPQHAATPQLPISPLTGEPFDPEWGALIQKGGSNQGTIQQVMKPEIERKADNK